MLTRQRRSSDMTTRVTRRWVTGAGIADLHIYQTSRGLTGDLAVALGRRWNQHQFANEVLFEKRGLRSGNGTERVRRMDEGS